VIVRGRQMTIIKSSSDNKIKYIIINKEKRIIYIVPAVSEDSVQILDFKSLFPDHTINILSPFLFDEEIKFIWPQILDEFKGGFSYINKWLSRTRLIIDGNTVKIETENNLSYKKINRDELVRELKNRFLFYTGIELNVEIINGNFLEEISFEGNNNFFSENTEGKKIELPDSKKEKMNKKKDEFNNIILGRKIENNCTHLIKDISIEENRVIVEAEIFDIEESSLRNGRNLLTISLTDKKDSILAKIFHNNAKTFSKDLKIGDWVKIRGKVQYDNYLTEYIIIPEDIMKIMVNVRRDNSENKRVELHLHTKMSAMDAVVDIEKVIKKATEWGHKAIAITDHGVVQAFPEAYQYGEKYGIKIIYGIEAYMVDDGEPIIINPCEGNIDKTSFTVFDLETTGLNYKKDEIIEIGAVKVLNGKIINEFSTFIKPEGNIPAKITEITGINKKMVASAPYIREILGEFLEFIGDSVLVAHNAGFDYGFLKAALEKCDMENTVYTRLDTLALSRALLPELKNHKLDTIAEFLKVDLKHHHRAINDARATAEIFLKFILMMNNKGINSLKEINKLIKNINWKNLYPYHTVILVKNKQGLENLYRLVSNSHLHNFYRKPRILKSELIEYRDGLLIGSACESGQLFRSILENKSFFDLKKIAEFYDYFEVQPIGNNKFLIPEMVESEEELIKINKDIYKLAKKLNKPVVATGDVHYIDPEDQIYRKVLQIAQGYNDTEEKASLYFRTTDEMLQEFNYLEEEMAREIVIENSTLIADMIEELKPIPDGLFTPEIDGAEQQIREMAYNKAYELYGEKLPEMVIKRLDRELKSIIDNGYSVIYLIAYKLVKKSLEDNYLVGSRGSVGSSLVATMCGITEVNPLPPHYRCPKCKNTEFISESIGVGVDLPDKNCPICGTKYLKDGYDIPFEVFMGFKGDKVPDIDLNFSGEYQSKIHQYTEELFGRDFVFRAGTISTIAERTAYGLVKGYMKDTNRNLKKAEIKRLVKGCTGVKRTTGQHPGGLMVVPQHLDIHKFSPIQHPANDQNIDVRTTHFDYHSISGRILKLDLLGHDDPTFLRMLQDLTNLNPLSIPLDDKDTMAIFTSVKPLGVKSDEIGTTVGTLGIPEFGTRFVRQMLIDTKPTTFAELIRISGLSHGTDVWLNNAQDLIKSGIAKLKEVISVRDDIMNYLIQKGLEPAKAFWIMEHVRNGKGLNRDEEEYMRENNVSQWYIDSCNKIKYMFPKAHAAAYVMMAFRIAYFKVHYPLEFYSTYFSIKADEFDAYMISQGYEEIIKIKKELLDRGNNLTTKERGMITVLEIVIEAMVRGIKFARVDLYKSDVNNFKIIDKNLLLPPLVSLQGLGRRAATSIASTRQEGNFSSIEDIIKRTSITKTVVEILMKHGALNGLPEKDQLSLF
jgi:DNA polymerase III subunit alpha, Gram-positive type